MRLDDTVPSRSAGQTKDAGGEFGCLRKVVLRGPPYEHLLDRRCVWRMCLVEDQNSLSSMTGSDLVAAKIMKKAKKALQKSESFRKGGVKHNGHRTCNGSVLTGGENFTKSLREMAMTGSAEDETEKLASRRRKEERIKSHFEELLYGQGFMHAERETVQKTKEESERHFGNTFLRLSHQYNAKFVKHSASLLDPYDVRGDAEPSMTLSPPKVGRLASLSIPVTARGGSISISGGGSSSHYSNNNNGTFSASRSNSTYNNSYQSSCANNGNSTPFSSAPTPGGFERKASVTSLGATSTSKERERERVSSIDSSDDLCTLKKLEKMRELTPKTRKLDILVVDDSEVDRAALSEILTSEGHNCFCSCDGIDAIEKFLIVESLNEKYSAGQGQGHHLTFDVVIVDFVMPGMDGPQCVRRMRDMGFKGLALGMVNAPASQVRRGDGQQ
jgi:CheY-like chemotaxis protein